MWRFTVRHYLSRRISRLTRFSTLSTGGISVCSECLANTELTCQPNEIKAVRSLDGSFACKNTNWYLDDTGHGAMPNSSAKASGSMLWMLVIYRRTCNNAVPRVFSFFHNNIFLLVPLASKKFEQEADILTRLADPTRIWIILISVRKHHNSCRHAVPTRWTFFSVSFVIAL